MLRLIASLPQNVPLRAVTLMICLLQDESKAARKDNITMYAVGVPDKYGGSPNNATLFAIAGDNKKIFNVTNFSQLDGRQRLP